jgi:hypothetical protein
MRTSRSAKPGSFAPRSGLPGSWLMIAMLIAPTTVAQSNLGEVLDVGGKMLSSAEFRQEVVGRPVSGMAGGTRLELFYIDDGRLSGAGSRTVLGGATGGANTITINGSWNLDANQRVCTVLRVELPAQCQYWFKHGDIYFLSDSDWDRQSKVVRRSVNR